MSALLENQIEIPKVEGVRIELRGDEIYLIGHCCRLPFATVPFTNLLIQSRHGNGNTHTTPLNAVQLRGIADVVDYLERLRG